LDIRIGTSGYSFKDWRGVFYPEDLPPREMLGYYAEHFKTVEVNSTYYRIPSVKTFQAMARKTPEDFEFTVKTHSDITHSRENVGESAEALQEVIRPLIESGKFGVFLAQFPYSFKLSDENMDYLAEVGRIFEGYPLVVEFRHFSWIRDDVFEFLRENGIGYCCVDEPRLRGLVPPVATRTSEIGYVRFHGRNAIKWWDGGASERYDYLYSKEELIEWKPKIEKLAQGTDKTYVFFNNCHNGQAAINAQMMIELFDAVS
jgi:uncharacterized protein YecE (DUF72 family)